MSPRSTSAASPIETTWLKPTPWTAAQSSMASAIAPDCDTSAISPGFASICEKLASSFKPGN